MFFDCARKKGKKIERWKGAILGLREYASHVVFGKTVCGGFACMPDFGAGCHLAGLNDKFWNTEKLTEVLGEVDGITVASALYALSDKIDL